MSVSCDSSGLSRDARVARGILSQIAKIEYFPEYFPFVPAPDVHDVHRADPDNESTTRALAVAAGDHLSRTRKQHSSSPNASVTRTRHFDAAGAGTIADAQLDDQHPRGSTSFTQAQDGRIEVRSLRLLFGGSMGRASSPPCSLAPSRRKGFMAKRSESLAPFGRHAATSQSSNDSSGLQLSSPAIFLHNNTLYAQ
jgi:hypothetical protein